MEEQRKEIVALQAEGEALQTKLATAEAALAAARQKAGASSVRQRRKLKETQTKLTAAEAELEAFDEEHYGKNLAWQLSEWREASSGGGRARRCAAPKGPQ